MAFLEGLTLVDVNKTILVENTSGPFFDSYVLSTIDDGNLQILTDTFYPGSIFYHSYSTPGIKTINLTASQIIKNSVLSATFSATFTVGYSPEFLLSFDQYADQSRFYSDNYVISGKTFTFSVIEKNTASDPKTYTWNYAGGITYTGRTSDTQILLFNDVTIKNVGLTISNMFGSEFKNIKFNVLKSPALNIIASPTFGNIQSSTPISLQSEFAYSNGHFFSDVDYSWMIDGEVYDTNPTNFVFGSTGIKGITLFYSSKILTGLTGHTYGEYNVTRNEIPIYYDPAITICFLPSEPEYAYYNNQFKNYAIPYRWLDTRGISGFAPCTYNASVLGFETFLSEEERLGPIMINAEYPWLTLLGRADNAGIKTSWLSDQTIIQEAKRQGKTLAGMTLAGYKELAINCWKDIVYTLRQRGASHIIHYGSSGLAFSNYVGVPSGMLEYGPLGGVTANHYWYQANSTYDPTMRDAFESKITNNSFGYLLKAQTNADANGAAAYSFIPNSPAGLCGISYWGSNDIVLVGYSGGTTFISPTDFTPETLTEATKVTSAKMWLEFYRACERSAQLGFCSQEDIPSRVAMVISYCIFALFYKDVPGGGFMSRFKFTGSLKKDPTITAENEVLAAFQNNYRINYSNYTTIKKPDEVWIWDFPSYWHINIPCQAVITEDFTDLNIQAWMMRNAMEKEYFGRPELSPGHTLWSSGNTTDNINYYKNNSLNTEYWNNQNSVWWGYSGGTLTSLLPSPCVLNQNSELAPWLNFSQPIYNSHIRKALKHRLTTHGLNLVTKMREKLNTLL